MDGKPSFIALKKTNAIKLRRAVVPSPSTACLIVTNLKI
jgi:hypothetical protein